MRQYTLRYINNQEIKDILIYFNCNLNENVSLKYIIDNLTRNNRSTNEITNRNIQFLQSLYLTRPHILNYSISKFI